jgi:protein-disulfide isomerase
VANKRAQRARAEREAAMLAAKQEAERQQRNRLILLLAVGLVAVVGIGWWAMAARDQPSAPAKDIPANVTEDFGVALGPTDAADTVVIYEDFLCPFCGKLETTYGPQLIAAAESGDVRVEYRPLNFLSGFGDYSLAATNAFFVVADAAGPKVAAEFHNRIFQEQPEEKGPYPDADWLIEQAVSAGAQESAVRSGIETGRFDQYVANATDNALRGEAGIQATPTVIINGEAVDPNEVDAELAKVLP